MSLQLLSNSTLQKLPSDIQIPSYNRSEVKVGIFHFGVGGFHRAHQALYIDNLLSQGNSKNWGICGVNILPQIDQKIADVMKSQNQLYTLVEKHSSGKFSYRVIGSIVDYLYGPDNVEELIERLAGDEAKIVTLTITEGGYNTNPLTGEFDLKTDSIQHDLKNLKTPKTTFGIIVEALRRRKERNLGGFTILSCDNLQENGHIAEKSFTSFAKAVDENLYDWMKKNVSFPNSMVDRITPVTTSTDRQLTSQKLQTVTDQWPVVCEDFLQWVIEDKFVAGRPEFEKVGVQMVPDVAPYEYMKLRLLNAGHQAIAYFGLLLGFEFVHDVTRFDLITKFLKDYMDKEATSTLKELPGFDVSAYKEKIIERFQNSHVKDTLARLAVDGSDRVFKFVIPVIVDRLKMNEKIHLSTAIVASFAFYLNEINEKGEKIEIVDRAKEKLLVMAKRLQSDAKLIENEHEMFSEVVKDERFVRSFEEIYEMIKNCGSEKTLKWLLNEEENLREKLRV